MRTEDEIYKAFSRIIKENNLYFNYKDVLLNRMNIKSYNELWFRYVRLEPDKKDDIDRDKIRLIFHSINICTSFVSDSQDNSNNYIKNSLLITMALKKWYARRNRLQTIINEAKDELSVQK